MGLDFMSLWMGLSTIALGWVSRRRDEILATHPQRISLLGWIRRMAGINMSRLERLAGLTRSSVRHHLDVLERAGLIEAVELGRERHYVPFGTPYETAVTLAAAHHRRGWELLRIVIANPGIRQKELLAELKMPRKTLRSHVEELEKIGLLQEVKDRKRRAYYCGPAFGPAVQTALGLPQRVPPDAKPLRQDFPPKSGP